MIKVLFVCMGNICRSPTAEGVFRDVLTKAGMDAHVQVDSAGTHAYHVGEGPDARSQEAAQKRGIDLSGIRARQLQEEDFFRFDYILVMDQRNLRDLRQIAPLNLADKAELLLNFSSNYSGQEVPDPYYGGESGFEQVLDRIEDAAQGLLLHLQMQVDKN
ncbi:low molecular weight protein-tyrosine-phosphatase [Leeia oryzae]|uniref:low molecular weight protein-tyrosine-phosphatase n=1 Tax=Leeia oryzae TaxID=356662 RepID=UPI0003A53F6F|nr:low molecular weight protein-tyrosine-phosphatase [Leeia oryzae]